MGCNCKNKQRQQKIVPDGVKPIEIQTQIQTTLEEVMTIENMVDDINTDATKRGYVTEFFMRNYGDPIINYCDILCMRRLKERLTQLKSSFIQTQ